MNPELFAAAALIRIRNQDDFLPVRQWLAAWKDKEMALCVTASELVYRQQGRAKILLELIAAIEDSPATTAKLSGRK